MRTAVCFSGLPRAVVTTYKSLQEKFGYLHPDVFAYFWTGDAEHRDGVVKESIFGKDYEEEIRIAEALYSNWRIISWKTVSPKNLVENFSAKHLSREKKTALYRDKRRNALSMFKGIYEANQLKSANENKCGFKYDRVIRARTDISLRGKYQIFLMNDPDTIYIPHIAGNKYQGGYSDVFAWGPSEAMDYYSDVYPNFLELQKDFWGVNHGKKSCFWNSHLILKKHLDKGSCKVNTFGTDMRKRSK